MKTKLAFVFTLLAVSFLVASFISPAPAAADGLIVLQCPPIVVPMGTPVPLPMPWTNSSPSVIPPGVPPITPRPIVRRQHPFAAIAPHTSR